MIMKLKMNMQTNNINNTMKMMNMMMMIRVMKKIDMRTNMMKMPIMKTMKMNISKGVVVFLLS